MSTPRRLLYPARGGETVEERLLAEGYSKRLLVALKQLPDGLTVSGERVRSTRALVEGETLAITLPFEPPPTHRLDRAVPILYEDEDIMVYNKPAGLVCHRSGSHQDDTLENAAEGVFRAMNRLDKDTSGALVAAVHQLAAAKLWRRIDKEYLAVVSGRPERMRGRIALPLERETPFEPRQIVSPDGREAVTDYEVIGVGETGGGEVSLLRCRLLTGRMHQIRVHCAAIGHPLLGDSLYAGDCRLIARQALHCARVAFCHPVTGERMAIEAPLPDDLRCLLAQCGIA